MVMIIKNGSVFLRCEISSTFLCSGQLNETEYFT